MANSGIVSEYLSQLQVDVRDIEAKIEKQKTSKDAKALQVIVLDIAKVRKQLVDVTPDLPPYDQRQSEALVKKLELDLESLRSSTTTRGMTSGGKFSFKRSAAPAKAASSAPSSSTTVISPPITKPEPKPTSIESQFHTISKKSNTTITTQTIISSTKDDNKQISDLALIDLSCCFIDLARDATSSSSTPLTLRAVRVQNLRKCVLVLPIIEGSVLLDDCVDCVIAVGCHQFRMHKSHQTDVYLYVTSLPVIEDCSNLRIGSHTAVEVPTTPPSLHESIQDFDWLTSEPSPHWKLLPKEQTLGTSGREWPTLENFNEDTLGDLAVSLRRVDS